jgi:hypothetical protein
LLLDLVVSEDDAILAGFDQQIKECLSLLLAHVVVVNVQVVFQTS